MELSGDRVEGGSASSGAAWSLNPFVQNGAVHSDPYSFEDDGDRFVSRRDLRFAVEEHDRAHTDIASNLVSYGVKSAAEYADFLSWRYDVPRIQGSLLRRTAAACDPKAISSIVKSGRIPVRWSPSGTGYVAILPASTRIAYEPDLMSIEAVSTRQDVGDALRAEHEHTLLQNATRGLARTQPEFSADRRLNFDQTVVTLALAMLFLGLAMLDFQFLANVSLSFLMICFLSVATLRTAALWPPPTPGGASRPSATPLSDDKLPRYSVLVPLLREANMVPQLLDALCSIDYPAALLDIKLILEKNDLETIDAVRSYKLPGCIEVILVPPGHPQTKPKALNYALPFAVGDLLVIYDAEDIPEPDQLRKAAEKFANSSPRLACLQAKLTFYNPNKNWLTRQFALEYASLFDVILPALSAFNQPIPLGGTSNHFRTSLLRKIGGWDPYNVTEDADLGIRLDRFGFEVSVLQSSTYEEAVSSLLIWLRQRSRWLKGWAQTWLVHMRDPVSTYRDMGLAGFVVFQILIGGILISTLVHPFFLVMIIYGVLSGAIWPVSEGLGIIFVFGVQAVVLLLGYSSAMLVAIKAAKIRGLSGFTMQICTMPLYWIMISVAGWYALWQLIVAPFYWEKTQHGHPGKRSARSSRN